MPSDPILRNQRQQEILAILRDRGASSQGELIAALAERGVQATQSSVSRDLRDLGIARVGGRYIPPVDPADAEEEETGLADVAWFIHGLKPAGAHLTVVFTATGAAQTVALAIDRAGWAEVVGTMAGDDTIFVATAGALDQKHFIQRLERLLEER
jgi:transcriptional regulator of arginine metabolism